MYPTLNKGGEGCVCVPLGINNYSIDGKRVIVVIVFNNHIARNTKLGLGVLNHHQDYKIKVVL